MLFSATHKHESKDCPLKTDEGVEMLKEIFSKENMQEHKVDLESAYVSCPKEHSTHHGYFIIDADSKNNVKNFFGPLKVTVREVVPFNEISKTL
ncbi:MAG TPA: hypothetical protein VK426_07740 [Methanobacterium sp.]|nr:hypothetical protein [Methanobacterium sp.]